jgi:hypothetical protein
MLRQKLVLAFAIAALVGCSHNNKNHPTTMASAKSSAACGTAMACATPAPAVATDQLAGSWQLAMPRQKTQDATITATDATHITIKSTDATLSGNYLVQGKYLLILTRDEMLRPLCWKINSADSLTIVRSPELGDESATKDLTGVTLIRAASDANASSDGDEDNSQANTSAGGQ